MRRTWFGAAAAAGITAAAATGMALAQERQDQQTPETQHMERGRPGQVEKGQGAAEPAAGQAERRMGQEAQEEKPPIGTERGEVRAEPGASAQQKAQMGQDGQPEDRQSEKAQTGQIKPEMRQGEKAETGQAQRLENRQSEKAKTGQAAESQMRQSEKAPAGQANAAETRQGGATQSSEAAPSGQGQQSAATGAHPRGNAVATGNVHISSANTSRIADALMSTGSSQHINVAVNIGAPLPGDAELLPLPPAVVSLVPEYRGYEYVVANDEIIIVQPSTRMVVEIIRPGGVAEAPSAPPAAGVTLTDAQRQLLVDSVRREHLHEAQIAELTDGETVPQDIQLAPVPTTVVAQVPMIERYRLFIANDQVVLVDPNTRAVVDIVR